MSNGRLTLKKRAPRNRTIQLTRADKRRLKKRLISLADLKNKPCESGIIHGPCDEAAKYLPRNSVDLMVLDPPYNMNKSFNGRSFSKTSIDKYTELLRGYFEMFAPLLKDSATIYICGDWRSSASIYQAADEYFVVRNRITWEREKGRGAKANWKNACEDIWFCTVSDKYTFNLDEIRLRRKVRAPYRDEKGRPKDWKTTDAGNFRDTAPSNIWSDITIPFWSMPENTDHPTQKSEKLMARLILASSNPDDLVFDPFLGSGTTAITAKKLGRRYIGMEIDEEFCLLAQKRLEMADVNDAIQGYSDGIFWERNSFPYMKK
ncbi:MAG: site-specific DNA-methyltransferase [candidate division Zixibacteria bacterium]|nr:site-specific DNA-methyltransferase [candidate division Zixibacteria bacterium]